MCPKCEKPSKSQFPLLMLYLPFAFLHLIFGNKFQLLCLLRSVINRPAMCTLKCTHLHFSCTPARSDIFFGMNVLVWGIIRMHSKFPKLPRSGLLDHVCILDFRKICNPAATKSIPVRLCLVDTAPQQWTLPKIARRPPLHINTGWFKETVTYKFVTALVVYHLKSYWISAFFHWQWDFCIFNFQTEQHWI